MPSPGVVFVIVIALIGWFATIRAISTSKLSEKVKRWLLIPSWIPWMAIALGAPIFTGLLQFAEAVNIGGAMTAGMMVAIVMSGRQSPRR
jgi:hypothetical protein